MTTRAVLPTITASLGDQLSHARGQAGIASVGGGGRSESFLSVRGVPSPHLATQLGRRCDGMTSPVLAEVAAALSARQEEIAALAAAGLPSKAIGERTHVSARTVDNHLRAVYRILDIAGRDELAALFPGNDEGASSGTRTEI